MSLRDLKIGDRVQVFDINGKRVGQPSGGWDGTVTKIGRKLVTVKYQCRTKTFRLDTGGANDDYGHQYIRTVEQVADELRRSEATTKMRQLGLELRWQAADGVSTDKLERLVQVLEEAE